MAEQINQKDANQDQEIFLLKHRIEDAEKVSEELRDRVRKLEGGFGVLALSSLLPSH